jgi:thiamine-phosphate pyrophosphorylase
MNPKLWDVYLVTDRYCSRGRTTLEIVEAALNGEVSAVQLREKDLETREFFESASTIKHALKNADTPLIINDRIDIAMALNADGVHLGQSDMPLSVARQLLGTNKIIGISINSLMDLNSEVEDLADYVAISPVFATKTKTDTSPAWGLEGLKRAREKTRLPIVGIGSMNKSNAESVIMSGADCIAVVSAIVSADDPRCAARELKEMVQNAKLRKGFN